MTTRLRVSLFWLGKQPLIKKKDYLLKLGTARVPCRLEEVHRVVDASNLSAQRGTRDRVERHEVAECTLKLNRAVAFDPGGASWPRPAASSSWTTTRSAAAGSSGRPCPTGRRDIRAKVMLRNFKWEPSLIAPERRAEKYSQKASLLLDHRRARRRPQDAWQGAGGPAVRGWPGGLFPGHGERALRRGRRSSVARRRTGSEHLRRLGEVANILLDAGALLIVTAQELTQEDLEIIKTAVDPERIEVIWVGDQVTTDITCDLVLGDQEAESDGVDRIKRLLQDKGVLFRPW